MIVSIHQPGYLPWPGYFHRLSLSDVHVFFDDVQFEKHGFNNRGTIKTAHGARWLTVPVRTRGRFGANLLNAAEIADDRWRERHWRTLVASYRRAPYFERHAPFFESVYRTEWKRLLDLNLAILDYLLSAVKIAPRLVRASDVGVDGTKSARVLNLCRALGATVYFSGTLGRGYLDEVAFAEAGVRVVYQDYRFPIYPQLHGEFVPGVSVIDLLFNCGPTATETLLAGNVTRDAVA